MEHLRSNIQALSLQLATEDITEIEQSYDFDPGFPHDWMSMAGKVPRGPEDIHFLTELGHFDYVERPQAVKPHQGQLNVA